MGFASRVFEVVDLIPVPDLDLRQATQINSAVGHRNRFVLDQKFNVAKFFVGCGVRSVTIVDQFTVLNFPILGEFRSLLGEIRLFLFAHQSTNRMRI